MPKPKLDENTLQQLQHAIESDAPDLLQPILNAGASVNQRIGPGLGTTLLEFAIEKNAIDPPGFRRISISKRSPPQR